MRTLKYESDFDKWGTGIDGSAFEALLAAKFDVALESPTSLSREQGRLRWRVHEQRIAQPKIINEKNERLSKGYKEILITSMTNI